LPPPVAVAAVGVPPVFFAPPAFALVTAPPVLAFSRIGPGFVGHGFIAERFTRMRPALAVAGAERMTRFAARPGAFRGAVAAHTRTAAFADPGWPRSWRGRGFGNWHAAWRGPGPGGWREARQEFGGWRGRWR
jgi:hypothetical protein